MHIEKLYFRGFRNLEEETLAPDSYLNVFLGDNAQGKTNLLEAIYVLIKGASFRHYTNKEDWVRIEESSFHIQAQFLDASGFRSYLEWHYLKDSTQKLLWNGKPIRHRNLSYRIPIVVFSPEDHLLIRGSPEERRDFFDEVCCEVAPGYLEILERFEKNLKQRNQLLKKLKNIEWNSSIKKELQTWNQVFIKSCTELAQFRRELFPVFEEKYQKVLNDLFPELASNKIQMKWIEDTNFFSHQIPIEQIFEESLEKDIATGWTHRGPHRDDFCIHLNDLLARQTASQGQAKLLAFALKWTQSFWIFENRRETPIFLLDDFSSELDAKKRHLLLSYIADTKSQIFITSTFFSVEERQLFPGSKSFQVIQGKIQ